MEQNKIDLVKIKNFRLPESLIERFDEYCNERGLKQSYVAENMIVNFLKTEEKKDKKRQE